MYQKPTITKIGNYRTLTNGAGKARERDLLGFSAVDRYPLALGIIYRI